MSYQTTIRFSDEKPEQVELAKHLDYVAENTDYAKTSYIRDLIRADMEAVGRGHDPVEGLRSGLDEISTIETWDEYDPDKERTEPLSKEVLRSITDADYVLLNPDHVDEAEVPNGAAVKTEIVLSVLRYWAVDDNPIRYEPREERKRGQVSSIRDSVDMAIAESIGATRHHLDSGGTYSDIPGRVADHLVPSKSFGRDGVYVPVKVAQAHAAGAAKKLYDASMDRIGIIRSASSMEEVTDAIEDVRSNRERIREFVEQYDGKLQHPTGDYVITSDDVDELQDTTKAAYVDALDRLKSDDSE